MAMRSVLFFTLCALLGLAGCCKHDDGGGRESIPYTSQIPMLAWIGIPQGWSIEHYQALRDAGFTHQLLSGYGSLRMVEDALEKSERVGVKCLVACPEMSTDTEAAIGRLKNHPALAGYTTVDEPKMGDLSRTAAIMRKYQACDPRGISYVNLLSLDTRESVIGAPFNEYFNRATRELPLQMLSCTFYPIVQRDGESERRVNGRWYENLERFSAKARQLQIPLWAFVLTSSFHHSTGGGGYPAPTLSDLRLQIYTNLAYGVQMLQYYTYSTPKEAPHYEAPIMPDGSKRATYDLIRRVNQEVIKLSGVFVGARVVDVWHTGTHLPRGTKALVLPTPFRRLVTGEGGALVSYLENGGRNYLMVVNHSCVKRLAVEIEASAGVREVDAEACLREVNWDEVRRYELEAGGMRLFAWE